jgi:hypothetical protein
LFSSGKSVLDLDKNKLLEYKKNFDFVSVQREAGCLELIKAITNTGIEVRYYEDGLYVLEMHSSDVAQSEIDLRKYCEEILNPAIAYIFSKGAPTPKILANIKTVYPAGVGITAKIPKDYIVDENIFGKVYSRLESKDVIVYKTPKYIIVVSKDNFKEIVTELIEMQIFFREFKDQLQKYLNIHRTI